MQQKDILSRDIKPAGEGWVWITSMGLTVGLTMIVFLLGMILYNGLEVFWPKPVVRLELKAGSSAGLNSAPAFGGEIIKTQEKAVQALAADPAKAGLTPQREYQLFVGNKDIYGFGYKFIDNAEIAAETRPTDIVVAERLEYGNAIFIPKEFKLADGSTVTAADAAFGPTFDRLVKEGNERRATIRKIERDQIGDINRELEEMRLQRRAIENKGPTVSLADQRKLADFVTTTAELQARYERLAAQARELRALQSANRIVYTTMDGSERTLASGDLIDYYYPNRLSFGNKAGIFAHRFWKFLVDEPREANTEGGIFPAIFGTFVMTLLMSIAVTPFGVLAAIYLREYAKQGLFVRSVRIAVNNLAGVPSIVFGVFGLGFFVYLVGGTIDKLFYSLSLPTPTFGTGGVLWAALTLALMTVPVVIVATEEALAAVSRGTREGSLACGASKWQTIQRIVLPASLPGILTGLILAMARGAGEVAPLMLVGVVKLAPTLPLDTIAPFIHLERKFMHLGFHIYDLGFQSPDSEAAKPMVFATTFLLILLVVCLNLGAILIRNHLRKKYRTATF
ncbi:MAG: phosphate ABC transporter permease PstA [Candidatus Didemnitutus sp.]|nr:phosphate ABC transporter permease PstA [Candidatus Didemnitutus sp.]